MSNYKKYKTYYDTYYIKYRSIMKAKRLLKDVQYLKQEPNGQKRWDKLVRSVETIAKSAAMTDSRLDHNNLEDISIISSYIIKFYQIPFSQQL